MIDIKSIISTCKFGELSIVEANQMINEKVTEAFFPFVSHLPWCNVNENWFEAEEAIAGTPDEFRDEGYYQAMEEIQKKKAICTCGLSALITMPITSSDE